MGDPAQLNFPQPDACPIELLLKEIPKIQFQDPLEVTKLVHQFLVHQPLYICFPTGLRVYERFQKTCINVRLKINTLDLKILTKHHNESNSTCQVQLLLMIIIKSKNIPCPITMTNGSPLSLLEVNCSPPNTEAL